MRLHHFLHAGFTLIELTCVIGIVSLLALFSYSSYQGSVLKARRSEAKVALMQVMQQQERYFSQHNRYQTYNGSAADAAASGFKSFSGESAALSAYQIAAQACPGESLQECVQLVATPGAHQTMDNVGIRFEDALCGTLTINSKGEKTAAGLPSAAAPAACW